MKDLNLARLSWRWWSSIHVDMLERQFEILSKTEGSIWRKRQVQVGPPAITDNNAISVGWPLLKLD